MSGENKVLYEAEKEAIRKFCKDHNIAACFEEQYPYAVIFCMEIPATLLDEPAAADVPSPLRIEVLIGSVTSVKISGSGALAATTLRKLIKGAENCADDYFRTKAEEAAR